MANLLWETKIKVKNLIETPFKTEDEFEKIVYSSKDILADVFTLKRQVRGGRKTGIPDIIGVDRDGNICLIEMKNETVEPKIISQVLEYAMWAKDNPDSIRVLWQEIDDKPEDIEIEWDDIKNHIRIIVIAPKIMQTTVDSAQQINYQVDFIEINRWIDKENNFYLVKKIEKETKQNKISPIHGLPIYDVKFYKANRNNDSVNNFMKYTKEVDRLVRNNKWKLEMKYNQNFCGYKSGFFNAFGIQWLGTKSFAFFVKITEKEAKKFNIKMTRYESQWKQAIYLIEPGKTKVKDYQPILKFAYEKLIGK